MNTLPTDLLRYNSHYLSANAFYASSQTNKRVATALMQEHHLVRSRLRLTVTLHKHIVTNYGVNHHEIYRITPDSKMNGRYESWHHNQSLLSSCSYLKDNRWYGFSEMWDSCGSPFRTYLLDGTLEYTSGWCDRSACIIRRIQ